MAINSYVKIDLTNPCAEDWNAMHPTYGGRFCDSCAKNVVDFTAMTESEIAKYLFSSKGNVCARVHTGQLNRQLVVEQEVTKKQARVINWLLRAAILAGIAIPAKAAVRPGVERVAEAKRKVADEPKPREIEVSGTVTDTKTGVPVQHANIKFSTNQELTTDETGRFKIILKVNGGPESQLVVTTKAHFYQDQVVSFTLPAQGKVIADIKLDLVDMPGNTIYGFAGSLEITSDNNHRYRSPLSAKETVVVQNHPEFWSTINWDGMYTINLPDSMTNRLIVLNWLDAKGEVLKTTWLVPNSTPIRRDLYDEERLYTNYAGGISVIISESFPIISTPIIGLYYTKNSYEGLSINFGVRYVRRPIPIFKTKWFKRPGYY